MLTQETLTDSCVTRCLVRCFGGVLCIWLLWSQWHDTASIWIGGYIGNNSLQRVSGTTLSISDVVATIEYKDAEGKMRIFYNCYTHGRSLGLLNTQFLVFYLEYILELKR